MPSFLVPLIVLVVCLIVIYGIACLARGSKPQGIFWPEQEAPKRHWFVVLITTPFEWLRNLIGGLLFLGLVYGFLSGVPMFMRGSSGPNMVVWVASYMTSDWDRPELLPEARIHLAPFSPLLQQDDEDRLRRLFPDPDDFDRAIEWGQRVYFAWRYPFEVSASGVYHPKELATLAPQVMAVPMSRELAAHTAWRTIMGVPGAEEADLFRLEAIVEQAEPDPIKRTQLLRWADVRRATPGPSPMRMVKFGATEPQRAIRPAPPDGVFFRLWTIYSEWCPTDATYRARLRFVRDALVLPPERFTRDTEEAILQWGADLAEERLRLQETFPAPSTRTALLAACDRLTGRERPRVPSGDPFEYIVGKLPEKEVQTFSELPFTSILRFISFFVMLPNDDLITYLFSGGWTPRVLVPKVIDSPEVRPTPKDESEEWAVTGVACVGILMLGQFMAYGMRFVTLILFGWCIGLRTDPIRRAYVLAINRRKYRFWTACFVVVVAGIATARLMEPFFVLYIPNVPRFIMIVFWSMLVGGVMVEGLRNLITVLFIRAGMDPRLAIIDDIIAAAVSVGLLWLFQNNWVSIGASVSLGLIPGLMYKVQYWFRTR